MSLSSALGAAMSGLDIAARRAAVVADNVAGAGRPGFGRRALAVTTPSPHLPGARAVVLRETDAVATALRRGADGRGAAARDPAALWAAVGAAIGVPGDGAGLSDRLSALEARLLDAAARPASDEALHAAATAADHLARGVRDASDAVVAARRGAEAGIVETVARLNADLSAIAELNGAIATADVSGASSARLQDQRAILLDRVSEAVAIRVLPRPGGAVALVSEGGRVLLDGRPATVGFQPAADVTPDRALGAGLQGLSVDGRPLPGDGVSGLGGGRLAGLFATRDAEAPAAQARLDAFAADLVARFSGPDADATLPPGAAGLFDHPGAAAGDPGRAGRLVADPTVLAEPWRLRDGLLAGAPDPSAPAGGLTRLLDRLSLSAPADPVLSTGPATLPALAAGLSSTASARAARFDEATALAAAAGAAAAAREAAAGVDVDEEMRRLVEVEQAYAAAARVVETVGDMMDRLTRI